MTANFFNIVVDTNNNTNKGFKFWINDPLNMNGTSISFYLRKFKKPVQRGSNTLGNPCHIKSNISI